MQSILRRFAWNNLSLLTKTALLVGLNVFLLVVIAVVQLSVQTSVNNRADQIVNDVVEIRDLSQQIQLNVNTMQSIEVRLVEDFTEPQFNPETTTLFNEHARLMAQSHEDVTELQARLTEAALPRFDSSIILGTVNAVHGNLTLAETNFLNIQALITGMTDRQTGTLVRLEAEGTQLENLAAQQTAASTLIVLETRLIDDAAAIRAVEAGVLASEGANAMSIALLESALERYLNTYRTVVGDERLEQIPLIARSYQESVDDVAFELDQLRLSAAGGRISRSNLNSSTSRLANLASSQTGELLAQIDALQLQATVIISAVIFLSLALSTLATYFYGRSLLDNIRPLLSATRELELGNFSMRAPARGEDEFSRLATGFNAMAIQLEGLVGGLEQRVAEATRDLTITGEIGRSVIQLRDPRELMNEIVNLIRSRFGFYHAQIFLLDDERQNANLVASTGAAGRELLARRHSLPVGSQSVIGQVTASGVPVIARDTDSDQTHRRNELLPDTRAEMALPMRIGDHVIGALDVQSVAPNAFGEDAVAVFQIMADQLAIALENARLYARLSDVQGRLDLLERNITLDSWRQFQESRSPLGAFGFEKQADDIRPISGGQGGAVDEAISLGKLVTTRNGEDLNLAIPIRVRGEVVGAFGFGGDSLEELNQDDLALIEAVTDRVGMALENLRLVEESSRRAEYEQVVNTITARIVGSTDVNFILQTTVRELGRILRAPRTSVQLLEEGKEE